MLEIISDDGYNYPLGIDTVITLELNSPMFTEQGSYSLAFDLPATAKTLNHLGFPDRIDNKANGTIKDSVYVKFESWTIKATLVVNSTYGRRLRANLMLGEGDFYNRLKDLLLSDLELGGQLNMGGISASVQYMNDSADQGYPEKNFVVFPVRNLDFWKDTSDETNWINNYEYQNKVVEIAGVWKFDSATVFTPFTYLNLILHDAFKKGGVLVEKNFFYDDQERRKLVIYNANELHYNNNNGRVVLAEHVPEVSVLSVKKAIDDLFNTCLFIVNGKGKYLSRQDVILGKEEIDLSSLASSEFELIREDAEGFKLEYNTPGNDSFWSDNIDQIKDFTDRIDAPVATAADLLQYTVLNKFRYVEDEDAYYRYAYNDDDGVIGWRKFSYNYFNKYSGDEKYSISADVSPLIVTKPDGGLKPDWWIPHCLTPGNRLYYHFYRPKREFSFRLLFYRGWQNDGTGKPYPLGSGDVYNYDLIKIPDANQSLKWEGDYGLYKLHWEKYIHWWLNIKKTYKTDIVFSTDILSTLDFSKKYRIGESLFLIKSIRIPIDTNGIKRAKVEMVSV